MNKKKRGSDVHEVSSKHFQETLLREIRKRSDDWSTKVLGRVEFATDLCACKAVYHQQCDSNFCTGRSIPTRYTPGERHYKKKRTGRPIDEICNEAFLSIVADLNKNKEKFVTVNDLVCQMAEHLQKTYPQAEAYTIKHMKRRLLDHFGSEILIVESVGQANIVTFQSKNNNLLFKVAQKCKGSDRTCAYDDPKTDFPILRTAAKIIRTAIQTVKQTPDVFPDVPVLDESMDYLPKSLAFFLDELSPEKESRLRKAAVGQALMQVIGVYGLTPPILFGLGIQLHHQFASRCLIDSLHSLGFSISYKEVMNFQGSAAVANKDPMSKMEANQFLQFTADNVDHQTITLDGHGTFHGMGIISALAPYNAQSKIQSQSEIPRLKKISNEELNDLKGIDIHIWEKNVEIGHCCYSSRDLPEEALPSDFDLLWKFAWSRRPSRPSWTGCMQMVSENTGPDKASIMFLPMLDLNPSSMTCVYSTMTFVANQARKHNVTPVLTFDQPLWWKAMMIKETESDLQDIVLRLGAFHAQMSFLGTIGHVMSGTGLEEALEQVYAGNTVGHIMSGKAVSRAMRGHGLVETALSSLLTESYDSSSDTLPTLHQRTGNDPESLGKKAADLYDSMMCANLTAVDETQR